MPRFEGLWVPLVTPFYHDTVDIETAQRLATDLVADGVNGIVVCGTTGEAATMDDNEQRTLLQAVKEAVGARCPVAMGIAGNDTRVLTDTIRRFNQHAPAAYLISAPSYVKPSQEGIRLHFEALAANADVPIMLYNIPARTGVNIDTGTLASLNNNPRFVAIKESSGNVVHMADILTRTTLPLLAGDDALLLRAMGLGAQGAISASAHIRTDLFVRVVRCMQAGQVQEAATVFAGLLPLIHCLFSESNPAPLKAALAMQGRIHNELRLPMTPMSVAGQDKLAAVLDRVMSFTPSSQTR